MVLYGGLDELIRIGARGLILHHTFDFPTISVSLLIKRVICYKRVIRGSEHCYRVYFSVFNRSDFSLKFNLVTIYLITQFLLKRVYLTRSNYAIIKFKMERFFLAWYTSAIYKVFISILYISYLYMTLTFYILHGIDFRRIGLAWFFATIS